MGVAQIESEFIFVASDRTEAVHFREKAASDSNVPCVITDLEVTKDVFNLADVVTGNEFFLMVCLLYTSLREIRPAGFSQPQQLAERIDAPIMVVDLAAFRHDIHSPFFIQILIVYRPAAIFNFHAIAEISDRLAIVKHLSLGIKSYAERAVQRHQFLLGRFWRR